MVGASTVRRVTILRKAPLPATLDPVEAWRETSWIGRQQHRAVTLAALHLCSHDRLVCLPFRLFGRHVDFGTLVEGRADSEFALFVTQGCALAVIQTPPDAPHDAEPCTSMCWPRLAVPDRVQRACERGRGGPLEVDARLFIQHSSHSWLGTPSPAVGCSLPVSSHFGRRALRATQCCPLALLQPRHLFIACTASTLG
jgi:hypothetical protein